MPRTPPGQRADYPNILPLNTRWADNDVFGHLNNVVYYSLFDTAVCTILVNAGLLHWRGNEHVMVMAESGCRYHSEAAFPDRIEAGLRIARLGTSSVRYELAVFREGSARPAAEGFMVHVCVDAATRRPAPMPDAWRKILQQLGG